MRENRTPGSVRGLLGNWQSYRDGGPTRLRDCRLGSIELAILGKAKGGFYDV